MIIFVLRGAVRLPEIPTGSLLPVGIILLLNKNTPLQKGLLPMLALHWAVFPPPIPNSILRHCPYHVKIMILLLNYGVTPC